MADPSQTTDVEAWRGLLKMLSDDELTRYSAIALDQYDRELKYWWAQALMVLGCVLTVGLMARGLVLSGIGRLGFLALGFSWMLGYWPYRSAKTRSLWWGHYAAVLAEQARRAKGGVAAGFPEEPAIAAGRAPPMMVDSDGRREHSG
jgi:hypothetical protein